MIEFSSRRSLSKSMRSNIPVEVRPLVNCHGNLSRGECCARVLKHTMLILGGCSLLGLCTAAVAQVPATRLSFSMNDSQMNPHDFIFPFIVEVGCAAGPIMPHSNAEARNDFLVSHNVFEQIISIVTRDDMSSTNAMPLSLSEPIVIVTFYSGKHLISSRAIEGPGMVAVLGILLDEYKNDLISGRKCIQ